MSWDAAHDSKSMAAKQKDKLRLVELLAEEGKVLISSEAELGGGLEKFRFTAKPEDMHHILAFAGMYVGEGGTMASEAAVLGTPSVYVNPLKMGYIEELATKYKLLVDTSSAAEAVEAVKKLMQEKNLRSEWAKRRDAMLADKIDVTEFMVNTLEAETK